MITLHTGMGQRSIFYGSITPVATIWMISANWNRMGLCRGLCKRCCFAFITADGCFASDGTEIRHRSRPWIWPVVISAILEQAGVDCSETCDNDTEQVVFAIRLTNFKTVKGPTSKHAVLLKKLVIKARSVPICQGLESAAAHHFED